MILVDSEIQVADLVESPADIVFRIAVDEASVQMDAMLSECRVVA